tara:strand:- start:383 stop:1123 length:741 start_codon:yes stop_codon:yes gene_type:complete
MQTAKDIIIKPIGASDARRLVKRLHYSGKVVQNSSLHLGVFMGDKCQGVMQFGSCINKKGTMNLVKDTGWNEFIELNRMAFSDALPRNSESRAIGIAMRLIKKNYPHIKWVISFADGTQCGDGTIYRASGFSLVGIAKNTALRVNPDTGEAMHVIQAHHLKMSKRFRSWKAFEGYQLKYVFFIDKKCKEKLTLPELPFSTIDEMGAGMYKGIKRVTKATSGVQLESGGAIPTNTLQTNKAVQDGAA